MLTKEVYLIPTDDLLAENAANLFFKYVYPHYRLGITQNLSTAFHPKTNGQSERTNQTLEQYLRAYVTHLQDNWVSFLPTAQFALNNYTASTARKLIDLADDIADKISATTEFAQKILNDLRAKHAFTQARTTDSANRLREPPLVFTKGQLVYLNTRHIKTDRPAKKLDDKWIGPFPVVRLVGRRAYKLNLPSTMKIFDTFYVSLLRTAATDPLTGQRQLSDALPLVVEREGVETTEWEVTAVLDSRIKYKKVYYKVQ
ncbi:unnamed protein product [Zymoseptoria tritici ST99CH_3D1]|nr:unnamed protein product [Zymoseptoria tritici ST99CH_3D1]